MRYDPHYTFRSFDGCTWHTLYSLTDFFHFAMRGVLAGRYHVAKGGKGGPLWLNQSNHDLRTKGWFFGDLPVITASGQASDATAEGLFVASDEGRGLVVEPLMYASSPFYLHIRETLPAALSEFDSGLRE